MTMKICGALLVMVGSGGIGLALSVEDRRQEQILEQLCKCIQWMRWELAYRMPSLPALCRSAAQYCDSTIGSVMNDLAEQLEAQLHPEPAESMRHAIEKCIIIPERAMRHLYELGNILGQFDLQHQISGLEAAEADCRRELEQIRGGKEARMRNYRTLSLCAGAGLVMILL